MVAWKVVHLVAWKVERRADEKELWRDEKTAAKTVD